jgi:hypothetical protein
MIDAIQKSQSKMHILNLHISYISYVHFYDLIVILSQPQRHSYELVYAFC